MCTFLKAEITSSPVEKKHVKETCLKEGMKEHGKPSWAKRCSWLVERKVDVRAERLRGSLSNANCTQEATE